MERMERRRGWRGWRGGEMERMERMERMWSSDLRSSSSSSSSSSSGLKGTGPCGWTSSSSELTASLTSSLFIFFGGLVSFPPLGPPQCVKYPVWCPLSRRPCVTSKVSPRTTPSCATITRTVPRTVAYDEPVTPAVCMRRRTTSSGYEADWPMRPAQAPNARRSRGDGWGSFVFSGEGGENTNN
ncbi:hypothetical protein EYF80_060233 [Liparis tanakae]|uniref:Uncharacterized protein n=1 Tax=Liparis tanakae TaxID=230148 RepID=A0A4Z2EKY6_9TELE|nr:hypothetical protein EYF80_060233 [Liparis tanakae]